MLRDGALPAEEPVGLVDEPVGLVVDMGGAVDEAEVGLWLSV
jgi:hypothetical protein